MLNKQLARDMEIISGLNETTQQKQVSVLLVERCVLLRKAIYKSVEAFSQVGKVNETDRVTNAVLMVKTVMPNIILLGTSVSFEECLSVTRLLKQQYAYTRVIVLSMGIFPEMTRLLIKSGIHVILDETATEQDLEFAIEVSALGKTFHSQRVYEQMIASFEKNDLLTSSEMQTLSSLMHGAENYVIAKKLNITIKTVEAHLTRIYRKLGVNSRAQAILRAQELHLQFNSSVLV